MDSRAWNDTQFIISASFPSARGFLNAILSIKTSTKHPAIVHFTADGLAIAWEDDAKTMQSDINMPRSLFSSYELRRETTFCLPLHILLDTLASFATSDIGELFLRYPGPDAELLLESTQQGPPRESRIQNPSMTLLEEPSSAGLYARICTMEHSHFTNLLSVRKDPVSQFIVPTSLVKEALDDIKWTKGDTRVTLVRDPSSLTIASSKDGVALEVAIPTSILSSFSCAAARVSWEYRTQRLQTAFENVGGRNDDTGTISRVIIDAQGLMQVVHVVQVLDAAGVGEGAVHPLAGTQQGDDGGHALQQLAIVNFFLLPLDKEDVLEDRNLDDS